ncbi:MAG: hypothetical protein K0S07_305 [Chlamydiales bacterium]|nr:hypothetical protein [Chlamydiales bacterium]
MIDTTILAATGKFFSSRKSYNFMIFKSIWTLSLLQRPSLPLKKIFLSLLILYSSALAGNEVAGLFDAETSIDLKEPTYKNGILSTDQGGVIRNEKIYIQAKTIAYQRHVVDGQPFFCADAKGALMVQMGSYYFIGDSLHYDFNTEEGVIENGKLSFENWFIGGDTIELKADRSAVVTNGFLTTTDNTESEWHVHFRSLHLLKNKLFKASGLEFRFVKVPIFWMPSIRADLNHFSEIPLQYHFQSGGLGGVKAGVSCRFLSWKNWSATLLADYSFKRGFGGGFDVKYCDQAGRSFSSLSYMASDTSILDPSKNRRYRLQGNYLEKRDDFKITFSYDRLSDSGMPADFFSESWALNKPQQTAAMLQKSVPGGVAALKAKVRLNSFQTVKEELPSLLFNTFPVRLAASGITMENRCRLEMLDYKYAILGTGPLHPASYHSGRLSINPSLYSSFNAGVFKIAPKLDGQLVYYTNLPSAALKKRPQLAATFQLNATTRLRRQFAQGTHIVEPRVCYSFTPSPTLATTDHYIFDLNDGLCRLQTLTLGVKNSWLFAQKTLLSLDLFAPVFLSPKRSADMRPVPRVYAHLLFKPWTNFSQSLQLAWDTEKKHVGYSNIRSEVSLSQNLAFALEYRYRDAFTLRKVHKDNFYLDAFLRNQGHFEDSLSDKRSTFLSHLFWRFSPWWSLDIESRSGWGRKASLIEQNLPYNEIQVALTTEFKGSVLCKFTVQRRVETGFRYLISCSLKEKKPPSETAPITYGAENYQ